MRKMLRKCTSLFVLMGLILSLADFKCYALDRTETSPNDSYETATEIRANSQTMKEYCKGKSSNFSRVNGKIEIACPSDEITMNANQSTLTVKYVATSSIPEGAYVREFSTKNVSSKHGLESIDVQNDNSGKNVKLIKYTFDKINAISLEIPCDNAWTLTFKRDIQYLSSSVTFSPSLVLYYIYPIEVQ